LKMFEPAVGFWIVRHCNTFPSYISGIGRHSMTSTESPGNIAKCA
jgi:hypothetical protein